MATGQHRNTATRDRHRNTIRAQRGPCGICGGEIDYALRTPHPDSFEVDHIIPRDAGGPDTLDNKQAAHRRCNRAKSNRTEAPQPTEAITTTRSWWTGGGVPQRDPKRTPAA
jgi:5-methylcytosine-specific restriction endonuclease McrA